MNFAQHFSLTSNALALLATVSSGLGQWSQYRGPNHDGVSTETIRINWSQNPPRQLWKVSLDPALSSFAVAGGKAFTQVRRPTTSGNQEFCLALDADSGVELWATPLGVADYPDDLVGADDGPHSTPSVDGERVYVLTTYLRLVCLEAATGQQVWGKDLTTEYRGTLIKWLSAASPLIEGDLILLNCNAANQSLLAFRKQDGSLAWKGQNDGMTQATPVAATIAGVRQAIYLAQSGLVSVLPDTGTVLWRYRLNYNGGSIAASPVVAGDQVYCSRAYPASLSSAKAGAVVVGLSYSAGGFSATQVWYKTNELMNFWSTPVHSGGYLYGIYGQNLLSFKCVEMATGNEQWSVSGFGYGSVLSVGGKILALADSGTLVLIEPDPAAYTELARFQAVRGRCWNVPAISHGRIYVRSTTEAAAFDVAPSTPPSLRLYPVFASNGNGFSVLIGNADGSALDPAQVANVDVYVTSDLSAPWTKLPFSGVLTNGRLRLDDPLASTMSQRFYKAQARSASGP